MRILALFLAIFLTTPAIAENDGWLDSNRPAHFAVGVAIGQALTVAGRGNNWLVPDLQPRPWYERLFVSTMISLMAGIAYEGITKDFDHKDALATGFGGLVGSGFMLTFEF